ncbi:endophilin-B2a isoform X6 [Syngnathus acus]|uniref:endophilin-B2a isoform X6 n=1 Tax=Syngnathus acus TaxID=161584 RepID=UPI001885F809|nr:endophilin-B2a isoform X6 [Syngnathus acus]
MDFNVKRLATGAGLLFTRAVQFTGEKLGQVEKTELDAHYENLMIRADCTKNWTEKIYRQTVVLLQPNPSARIEEFLYEKLDREVPSRVTNGELLGHYMQDAANEFGPDTPYGSSLIKVGECERRLGASEREFLHTSAISFLTPLRNFLEGDWRTISVVPDFQETRPRNYVLSASASAAEHELRVAQTEFDRQAEVTRLLLESISSTHMNHLRCLHEFVEAQATYYKQCHVHMQEVQKELGRRPDAFPLNSTASMASADLTSEGFSSTVETDTLKIEEVQAPAAGTRTAKVLYDYDAADSSELCLKADEIITVYAVPGMDSDWLVGEKGCQKGKVPVTYLELLS